MPGVSRHRRGRRPLGAPRRPADPPLELAYWYEALRSERGIKIKDENAWGLMQRLYALRRKAIDPRLDCLKLTLGDEEVWITKRDE